MVNYNDIFWALSLHVEGTHSDGASVFVVILGEAAHSYDNEDSQQDDAAKHYPHNGSCAQGTCKHTQLSQWGLLASHQY